MQTLDLNAARMGKGGLAPIGWAFVERERRVIPESFVRQESSRLHPYSPLRLCGYESADVAKTLTVLAELHRQQENFAETRRPMKHALENWQKAHGPENPGMAFGFQFLVLSFPRLPMTWEKSREKRGLQPALGRQKAPLEKPPYPPAPLNQSMRSPAHPATTCGGLG